MVVTHDVEVRALQYDSRKVEQGDCFVAIRGGGTDGHRFVEMAIRKGAKVVVIEDDSTLPDAFFMHAGVMKVVVPDTRKALALLSANYYGHPSRRLHMVGVTGTNGKTTTTHIVKSILESAGWKVGLIGTIEYRIGEKVIPATHTTPESLELQALLARMVAEGCTAVSMEVSSHALDQSRVHGIDYNVAAFTNLTQDHLDYHGTMERYFQAKKTLFDTLASTSWSVSNADDEWGRKIIANAPPQRLLYGITHPADVRATDVWLSIDGTSFVVHHAGEQTRVRSSLVGRFNVSNMLAAFSVGLALGLSKEMIQQGIARVSNVRGRFEKIPSPQGWTAIIDYAHTPDALEKCLHTIHDVLPKEGRGKIIVVFGAGGDRDNTKRPLMGKVAGMLADYVIVTSDNPRTEDPEKIIDEIVKGIPKGKSYERIADRRKAIEYAVSSAKGDDVILIAGKGHEEYQVIGQEKRPFSDRQVVEELLLM